MSHLNSSPYHWRQDLEASISHSGDNEVSSSPFDTASTKTAPIELLKCWRMLIKTTVSCLGKFCEVLQYLATTAFFVELYCYILEMSGNEHKSIRVAQVACAIVSIISTFWGIKCKLAKENVSCGRWGCFFRLNYANGQRYWSTYDVVSLLLAILNLVGAVLTYKLQDFNIELVSSVLAVLQFCHDSYLGPRPQHVRPTLPPHIAQDEVSVDLLSSLDSFQIDMNRLQAQILTQRTIIANATLAAREETLGEGTRPSISQCEIEVRVDPHNQAPFSSLHQASDPTSQGKFEVRVDSHNQASFSPLYQALELALMPSARSAKSNGRQRKIILDAAMAARGETQGQATRQMEEENGDGGRP